MSEINSVSGVGQNKDYNVKTSKPYSNGGASFSSYLGETKSLDDIFEEAAEKYNVPVDMLKAVGKAESDFNAKAVSRCGAQGIMQLMPGTAASLGVTDAFDPEQNIMGGAKYLAGLLKQFDGDTKLALAGYNAGPNNVTKYGGVPPFEETQNYVVKVMKYMGQDITAGDVSVASNAPQAPIQYASPLTNWLVKPSEQTQKAVNSDPSDILDSIFSYQDYMKFVDLLLNNNDKEKESGWSSYLM